MNKQTRISEFWPAQTNAKLTILLLLKQNHSEMRRDEKREEIPFPCYAKIYHSMCEAEAKTHLPQQVEMLFWGRFLSFFFFPFLQGVRRERNRQCYVFVWQVLEQRRAKRGSHCSGNIGKYIFVLLKSIWSGTKNYT